MTNPMTQSEYAAIINRQRRLPFQIWSARKKLSMLIVEAERNGMMADILSEQFNGDLVAMEYARQLESPFIIASMPPLAGYSAGLL